jgi:predicted RNA-binding protein with RPS1 domain
MPWAPWHARRPPCNAPLVSEFPLASWSLSLRVAASSLCCEKLRGTPEAESIARALAPDGSGPGVRFHGYGPSLSAPAKRTAYQQRFAHLDELLALLETGDPGALELGIEILSRLDPEACVPIAALLLPHAPWPMLSATLGRALGRCASEASFRLLIDHPGRPYLRDGLATNDYARGVSEAWALFRTVDFMDPALDPRTRVDVLPALSYLLRHDRDTAFPEAVRLLDAPGQVSVVASHAMLRLLPEGPAVLRRKLAEAPPSVPLRFPEKLAVKLLLEDDAGRAVDVLGGESFLASPEGRPRLEALLDWLRDDTFRVQRGWLAADPRFAQLCAGLVSDPDRELAALARNLVATLPKAARPKVPRAAKKSAPEQRAPDPDLLREMEALRDALTRLVAHLRATNYRFVEAKRAYVPPRASDLGALARLEKKVVVPSVLSAFWRTVGSVDLRGHHPSWPFSTYLGFAGAREPVWLTDPLVIGPAAQVIGDALAEGDGPPLALHLAPDALGKAGYSAGASTVWLPQDANDPALHGTEETLRAHLRRALPWAGFPGFMAVEDRPEAWLAPAREAMGRAPIAAGDVISAEVRSVEANGLFLAAGDMEGFVNITELSWSDGVIDPHAFATAGQVRSVRVYAVNEGRFYASIKDLTPERDPHRDPERHRTGQRFEGVVEQLLPFGTFVRLSTGARGRLPRTDARAVGTAVRVEVVSYDRALRKIELALAPE